MIEARGDERWRTNLLGRRVAILATVGVEQVGHEQPHQAVEQAGTQVTLLSIRTARSRHDDIRAMNTDIPPDTYKHFDAREDGWT